MNALLHFASALPLFVTPLLGCATEVEARPPRQPGQVVVVEPAGTVNEAPVISQGVAQGAAPAPPVTDADLQTWASRRGPAATAMVRWVHNNQEAANEIFSWEGKHPGRTHALVQWAIHHPGEDIG